MAEMEDNTYRVVWAKVRGYPWWPAVIELNPLKYPKALPEDSNLFVRFIGENTQYALISSTLHSKSLKDFSDHLETHSKTKNKKLIISIQKAKQFLQGESSFEDIFELDKTVTQKPKPSNKELKAKFKAIQEVIGLNSAFECSPAESLEIFHKHIGFLTELSKSDTSQVNITLELCEALYELAQMKVSSNTLQQSRVQHVLKMISHICKKSDCANVNQLGVLMKALRKHWKGLLTPKNEDQIFDIRLRRIVCQKIANALEAKSFCKDKARELAIGIEKKIRRKDPSMSRVYKNCIKTMMREFRQVPTGAFREFDEN